jgi:hypothetical protein
MLYTDMYIYTHAYICMYRKTPEFHSIVSYTLHQLCMYACLFMCKSVCFSFLKDIAVHFQIFISFCSLHMALWF